MDGLFKTAMNGFKKSDVLEFIDNQENDFKNKEKNLKDQIARLEGQLADVQKEKDELKAQFGGLQQELAHAGQSSDQAREQLAAVAEHSDALKAELFKSENVNNELRREIAIHKQNNEAKAAEIAEKAAETERLKNTINTISTTQQRISRVMVEAQNTADKIIDSAKEKAACLLCETEQKLSSMLKHADEMKNEADLFCTRVDSFHNGVGQVAGELSAIAARLGGERKDTGSVPAEGTPAAEKPAAGTEKAPEAAPAEACGPVKDARPGSMFDFSQGHEMFNWDNTDLS